MATSIASSWAKIESWLQQHAPKVLKSLRPGVNDATIAKLEKKLGLTLPDDVKESYRIHDGQREIAPAGIFPVKGGVLGPEPAYQLISLKDAGEVWSTMKELIDIWEFADSKSRPSTGIRQGWWSNSWIPIATNGAGDFFCIDMDPAKSGTVGQVILAVHDSPKRSLIASSLGEWLKTLAGGLNTGKFKISDDEDDELF